MKSLCGSPPPSSLKKDSGEGTGGKGRVALAYLKNRLAPTRCPCGRRGVSLRPCPPPPLSLCIALSLHAGVCARVPGPNVPVCIVLLQACRQKSHNISCGMEHPLGSTLP